MTAHWHFDCLIFQLFVFLIWEYTFKECLTLTVLKFIKVHSFIIIYLMIYNYLCFNSICFIHIYFIIILLQDPKASHDFNDNDPDPLPRDVDPDNW